MACGPHTYFGLGRLVAAGEGGITTQPIKPGVQMPFGVRGKLCRFIKHQVEPGNRLAIGINQDMQIFMRSCDSVNDGCALYPST